MFKGRQCALAVVVAAGLAAGSNAVWAGEAVSYTGSGNYMAIEKMMPLSSGDAVASLTTQGAVAISTTPPSLMDLKCSGMGLVKVDGDFGSVFYCSFTDSVKPADGFDIKGIESGDTVAVEVVGGGGRWAGAAGEGKIDLLKAHDAGGSFTFEFAITLPE